MSVDPVDQPLLPPSGPPPDPTRVAWAVPDLRRLSVRELIRALTAVEDARRRGGGVTSSALAAQEAAIVDELHGRTGGLRPAPVAPVEDGSSAAAPGGAVGLGRLGGAGGAGEVGGTASPAGRSADRPVGAPRLVVLPGPVPEAVVPDVVVVVQPAPAHPDPGDV